MGTSEWGTKVKAYTNAIDEYLEAYEARRTALGIDTSMPIPTSDPNDELIRLMVKAERAHDALREWLDANPLPGTETPNGTNGPVA